MKKIFSILGILCILSLSLLTACSDGGTAPENTQSENSSSTLKLYFIESSMIVWSNVINKFESDYPNVKVDITTLSSNEEYNTRINTEIMAGEGPDIVIFDPYTFESVNKIINNKVFCDINNMIKDDKTFKIEDYNKTAMECGVYDGSRYIIPIDYSVNSFITTEKALGKNNIKFNTDSWSLNELVVIMDKYKKQVGDQKYFFTAPVEFSDYVLSSGLKVVDYKTKKTFFNTPEFSNLLESYKNTIYNASASYDVNQQYGSNFWDMIKDGSAVADASYFKLSPLNLWMSNSMTRYALNEDARVYALPSYNGEGKYVSQPFNMIAINNKCSDKQAAFNFVKTVLSKDIQETKVCFGTPVNNQAYNEMLQEYSGEKGEGQMVSSDGSVMSVKLNSSSINDMNNIISKVSECVIPDMNVSKFINEAAAEYVQDNCSLEDTVKNIEQKVILYLNE